MGKNKHRYVMIDQGYWLAENWYKVKVIRSEQVSELFSGETKERLLVELPGGERVWADYWREIDVNAIIPKEG